uniref:S8 family serine peptidase n=1 Tax=Bosea sp. NBC_00436 TaxID=2969620 RepID=A0A9E8CS87_9HYPH
MADEPPRPLPHVYLPGNGEIRDYTARGGGGGTDVPARDRTAHAQKLTEALTRAVADAEVQLRGREPDLARGTPGFYLEFELASSQSGIVDKLENRQGKFPIELVSVRPMGEGRDTIAATVFVPERQRDYYLKKVAEYRDQDRIQRVEVDGEIVERNNGPKNEVLVASLETARLAVARSLYTDDEAFFPAPGAAIWWEVWLRLGTREAFAAVAQRLELPLRQHALQFPEREVLIVHATAETLGRIITHTDTIAELRTARDTPAFFMEMDGAEQRAWAAETAGRIVAPDGDSPAVCLLDSGSTRRHPLILPALAAADQQAFDPGWNVEDVSNQGHGGHGTQLSGVALYGDLTDVLAGAGQIILTHRLESVKILPDRGANDPDLFGAVTAQSVARAEIVAPNRPRAICLAVTSEGDHWRGRPSSWSAALDALAYGADNAPRLIAVSAGNIREYIHQNDYLVRNDTTPIESPAQAWNALTVGAFTEKTAITDPVFNGWGAMAQVGDLKVLLDGQEIAAIGLTNFRRAIGVVLQEDRLFTGTIAENVAGFDPEADQLWVEECARMAAILDEIRAAPMGFDSLVGDMGNTLSGGQNQRLFLARALYRRPRILFLDEATSDLDEFNEQKVNAAVAKLDISRVIVAHRPSTVAAATRTIALVDGRCR